MILTDSPTFLAIAARMVSKCEQATPMGFPREMQEAKTIASAPRSTIIFALATARFPGQPPQLTKLTTSDGPISHD